MTVSGSADPTAIDLFAGVGGTTLALRRAGFRVPLAVEIDPTRAASLAANHPNTLVLGHSGTDGDVRNLCIDALRSIAAARWEPLDLLVACPPCQGFSVQGSRNPNDVRNRLFEDILRLAEELAPRGVVVENVPGMARLYDGRFLSALLSGLEGLGLRTDVWTLRACDLGVPQDRERLFVVATRGRKRLQPPVNRVAPTSWEAIADLPSVPFCDLSERGARVEYKSEPRSRYAAMLRRGRQSVSGVERTRHADWLRRRLAALRFGETDSKTRHQRIDPRLPVRTITAGSRIRTACRPVHPYEDRVLTVREAARLASFPDWYEFSPQIALAWSEIGNAVPPMMATAVFKSVASALSRK